MCCIKERIKFPCQITVVCSVKRLHVIDLALWRENYIRKVFFVTLSCLQPTRCQQKAQHEIGQYKTRTADYGLRTTDYGLGIQHGPGIKRGLSITDWV